MKSHGDEIKKKRRKSFEKFRFYYKSFQDIKLDYLVESRNVESLIKPNYLRKVPTLRSSRRYKIL